MKVGFVTHELDAFFDKDSRVLILGTIPSPKSREQGFYYGHPQNRFWKVMADVLSEDFPQTLEERKAFLRRNHIALWDVLESCEIHSALDASIRNAKPNNINRILQIVNIQAIFTTGAKAAELYKKLCIPVRRVELICLPSTSSANCRCSYEKLREAYGRIGDYLK